MKRRILLIFLTLSILFITIAIPALANNPAQIIASNISVEEGTSGADITISLKNNPGIVSAKLTIEFDSDVLTLTKVKDSGVLGSTSHSPSLVSPYNLYWNNGSATENFVIDGIVATLTFNINENAAIGTYPIVLSYDEDNILDANMDNVNFEITNGSVTIAEKPKKNFEGLSLSDAIYTYDGEEKGLTVCGSVPEGANVTYAYNNSTIKPTNAGTYSVKATMTKEGYNDLILNAIMLINPKELTLDGLKASDKEYDGTTDAVVSGGELKGVVQGDDVSVIFPASGTLASANMGDNIDVSIPDIKLKGNDKDNYTLTQPTGLKANISPRTIVVTARNYTIKKDNSIPILEYDITDGSLVSDDTLTGALAVTCDGTKLGEYDITQGTLSASSNYILTFVNGKLTVVNKTPQDIVVDTLDEKTYGEASFAINATPDASANLTKFTYSSSNMDVAEVNADGMITIKSAGKTNISVNEPGNDEYAPFISTQELVVNKKFVSVTDINLDTKTAVLDGILVDDTELEIDFDKLNLTTTGIVDETTSNVTVSNINLKGKKSENYTVSTTSLETTITTSNVVAITINAANGTAVGEGSYLKGNDVTVTATANSGYKFSGWYIEEALVSSNSAYTFKAESDVTLVAKFAKKTSSGGGGGSSSYVVKFETNGGNKIASQSLKKNDVVKEPAAPTKEGYIFEGWYTDKELTSEYDFEAEISKGFTLYAKWTEVKTDIENPDGTEKPDMNGSLSFKDVTLDDWFYENVKYAVENKLMNGISENEFAPNNNLTRAMLVTVLYRIEGEPDISTDTLFDDVESGTYYEKATAWAQTNEIVKGFSQNMFAPDVNITREQMAAIIYRYAKYKGYDTNVAENSDVLSFVDYNEVSEYAVDSMKYAIGSGLVNGKSENTINPRDCATRAETAAILQRLIESNNE